MSINIMFSLLIKQMVRRMDSAYIYHRNLDKIIYDNKYINDFAKDNLENSIEETTVNYYKNKIINFNNYVKYDLPQHLDKLKKTICLFDTDQNKETYRIINRLANTLNTTIVRLDY